VSYPRGRDGCLAGIPVFGQCRGASIYLQWVSLQANTVKNDVTLWRIWTNEKPKAGLTALGLSLGDASLLREDLWRG